MKFNAKTERTYKENRICYPSLSLVYYKYDLMVEISSWKFVEMLCALYHDSAGLFEII